MGVCSNSILVRNYALCSVGHPRTRGLYEFQSLLTCPTCDVMISVVVKDTRMLGVYKKEHAIRGVAMAQCGLFMK